MVREGLGPLPLVRDRDEAAAENGDAGDAAREAATPASAPASNRPAVLPDGSYATQVRTGCGRLLEMQAWLREGTAGSVRLVSMRLRTRVAAGEEVRTRSPFCK